MYNRVEDFLKDDAFVKCILEEETDQYSVLFNERAESHLALEEAKQVLLAAEAIETDFSALECQQLKSRIFETLGLTTRC